MSSAQIPPPADPPVGRPTDQPRFRTRSYKHGRLDAEGFPPEDISETLEIDNTIVWVDLVSPTKEELDVAAIELGFHPLAVEDALHDCQRPKLDRYESHLFLSMYSVTHDAASGRLTTHELSTFMTKRALITVHKQDFAMDEVVKRWDSSATVHHSRQSLLHGLLDYVVDSHSAGILGLDDVIDDLEDDLFTSDDNSNEIQRRSFAIRKDLVALRRVVLPMADVMTGLLRDDGKVIEPQMLPYFRDVQDHVLRVVDWTERSRELVQSILDANLSLQSNRMNEVMKQLTSWAAIVAIPTAVTGYFGQNVPYPGSQGHSGFIASTALILFGVGALWITFRVKRWL